MFNSAFNYLKFRGKKYPTCLSEDVDAFCGLSVFKLINHYKSQNYVESEFDNVIQRSIFSAA